MLKYQRALRLEIPRINGESRASHAFRQAEFRNPTSPETHDIQFARLLKRLARRAMQDITECPVDTVPAHCARLDDLRELNDFALRHIVNDTPEARLSGGQLANPCTLADYQAALQITRKQWRAPSFVNQRDEDIADIKRMISTLAGLVSQSPLCESLVSKEVGQ